jgi:hypothetical protein
MRKETMSGTVSRATPVSRHRFPSGKKVPDPFPKENFPAPPACPCKVSHTGFGLARSGAILSAGRLSIRHSRAHGFGEDILILVPPYYWLNTALKLQGVMLIPALARLYVPVRRRRRKSCFCGIPRYLAS